MWLHPGQIVPGANSLGFSTPTVEAGAGAGGAAEVIDVEDDQQQEEDEDAARVAFENAQGELLNHRGYFNVLVPHLRGELGWGYRSRPGVIGDAWWYYLPGVNKSAARRGVDVFYTEKEVVAYCHAEGIHPPGVVLVRREGHDLSVGGM